MEMTGHKDVTGWAGCDGCDGMDWDVTGVTGWMGWTGRRGRSRISGGRNMVHDIYNV